MKFKVVSFESGGNYHKCIDDNNVIKRIDLFIDKELPGETDQSIIGKFIEIERLDSYIDIALGVSICSPNKD